jgi:hypothetical protein
MKRHARRRSIPNNDNIMSLGDWLELSIHTSLHCVCMVTFLTCFYFFYVYPIERDTLEKTLVGLAQKEFNDLTHSVINIHSTLYPLGNKELKAVYAKQIEKLLSLYLAETIKNVQPRAIAAQEKIHKDYIHAMVLSFTIIGVTTLLLIIIHVLIIMSNPNIYVHLNKIFYSVVYSIGFIIVIEVSFFLLITKNLKTVSSEELQYVILSAFKESLKTNGLSIVIHNS